jgi:precorrin isomerase
MLEKLLKHLATMFPGSDYQSRLEQYIANRHPQSTADVEHWERRYFEDQFLRAVVAAMIRNREHQANAYRKGYRYY